jgi:RNA-directed DNA polymerase
MPLRRGYSACSAKLYQQSKANPDIAWRDLWGWLTDSRTIRHAWRRVSANKGKRSAGVDGITAEHIRRRIGEPFARYGIGLAATTGEKAYRPSPSRRKLIPKPVKPGQFRPLGIPTVKVRVLQGAVKTILEPIFEADSGLFLMGFDPEETRMEPWSISG